MNSKNIVLNLASKMLQPVNVIPQDGLKRADKIQLSKGHKLMLDLGIIRPSSTGIYSILPLGLRSLDKMRNIIKLEMSKINAQEVKLPFLTDSNLWKKSHRWNNEGLGLFTLKDRHDNDFILSPTNEEVAADLIANMPQISHHQLPLLVYQISTKFRDELKPRCGLLKSKEFEMKDLYSFDKCLESAKQTYELVSEAYKNIFDTLGLPVLRVAANPGVMRGIFSHEFQLINNLGEDIIIKCDHCSYLFNSEQMDVNECTKCKSRNISHVKGIEVGHTFLLDTLYSKPLGAVFKTSSGTKEPLVMASYGLGLTRTLAAGIEYLSSDNEITWPSSIAPFNIVIITPKNGSKEYEIGKRLCSDLYTILSNFPHLYQDILIDDQENMTIGKRLLNASRLGYPYVIVLGSKVASNPPLLEIINIKDHIHKHVTFEEAISIFSENTFKKSVLSSAIQ